MGNCCCKVTKLGFIGLIFAQFWSETQHFEGHIILLDPFNPTYIFRLIARLQKF